MDKPKQKILQKLSDENLTHDDLNMLKEVLSNVRGSAPNGAHQQAYLDTDQSNT